MGEPDLTEPQGLDVICRLQPHVEVGGDGEDHELEQDDGEVLALSGEKGRVDQAGQQE